MARILIVDDEPAMHDSYRRSFAVASAGSDALSAMAADLFGGDDRSGRNGLPDLELVHHSQGLDAVAEIEASLESGERFAVAFIDVRMPPGIDGKETATRIRALDPEINLVIVTGFSDFSPLEISRVVGPIDKIFYIAKPFEVAEVLQTAIALAHRWAADRELAAAREALARQVAQLEEQAAELAANESRATHLANHDLLTEAPNRLAFLRTLTERVRSDDIFAVGLLDLDRFKVVNDTLGHLAGDELIRQVCACLGELLPDGYVARLAGDEFGLLFDTAGEQAACMEAQRLLAALNRSFNIAGHSVHGSASIGLFVTTPDGPREPVDLIRRADLALNDAKRAGRGVARLFDDSMDESIRFRRRIEGGLSQSIERNELSICYQAIVAREDMEVVGFEALLRWETEEFGPVSPSLFVPIAEESNLIHELGDWVLDGALAAAREWPDQYVSINFSPRQFRRSNFVGHLIDKVQHAGIEPGRVQIEITETAIFDNAERAAETLYKLRQMGFRIALDDFGTGYSSLYNIRKFALDCLKIDRSFVEGMGRERESAAIVHAIIHLGYALGLGVIAEGVETAAQAQALRLAGASHLQGFFFGQPLAAEQASALARLRFIDGEEPDTHEAITGTHA